MRKTFKITGNTSSSVYFIRKENVENGINFVIFSIRNVELLVILKLLGIIY